ncbi:cysteine-rich repeat secretory protein 3-like [Durio zibethinus]|uniref:Cysteine-rich repeat secretory protein 3-like n=1 Tax=Durio zibethinus TaxID=66656 RepID=A0A6P5YU90_DURZI|nr:cysteine-rich repeat secretory protein 3-like [Durio zibethinus]
MDSTLKPLSLLSQTLILLAFSQIVILPNAEISSDYSTFMYKNCTSQTFSDSTNYHSESLSYFFQELITKSTREKFYKTTTGDDNNGISGLFQCRGDLSNNECNKCIALLPEMSNTLCNKAVSARIQLHGCYVHYKADEFIEESSNYELLHKICDEKKAVALGFEEVRDAAFAAVESGVTDGDGYFKENYELMQVIAQCEGDLRPCDCGKCVNIAAQIAQEECGSSLSGQIYLDNCFITYGYYPDGIPDNLNQGRSEGKNHTGKLTAIVLGGAAALLIGYIFLMSCKKLGKKGDERLDPL